VPAITGSPGRRFPGAPSKHPDDNRQAHRHTHRPATQGVNSVAFGQTATSPSATATIACTCGTSPRASSPPYSPTPQAKSSTRLCSGRTASSPSATVTAAPTCGASLKARVCQLSDTLVTRRNITGTPGPRLRRNTRSPSRDGDPSDSQARYDRYAGTGEVSFGGWRLNFDHHVPSSGDPGRARALPAYTRAPDMSAHSPQPWRRHKSTRYALLDG